MDVGSTIVDDIYNLTGLSAEERSRAAQLEELYGFRFPVELFTFWRWHCELAEAQKSAFANVLGMRLVGPFDVLRGTFDGFDSAYPAILHWRFQFDPPEFVTAISGDTDGLHWGYWFDDHVRLPPVIAGYYARDSFEIREYGSSLFEALQRHMEDCQAGLADNVEYDPNNKDEYLADLRALDSLGAAIPGYEIHPPRHGVMEAGDGMGVIPPSIGGPEALEQLLHGKEMWTRDPREAGPVLEHAYRLADRRILASIVSAHTQNPTLPSVNILEYPRGSYHSLDRALEEPLGVRRLELAGIGLTELPDLSVFPNLEELSAYGNRLVDVPECLDRCQGLRRINLFRNRLTKVPEVLYRLPQLELVILGNGVPEDELERLRRAIPDAEVR